MGLSEKTAYLAAFSALSMLGGILGQTFAAAWKTDDRIESRARAVAEVVGADAARRVVRDEIGPVVGAAVAASVGPIAEKVTEHVAKDDERQRRTDEAVQDLRESERRRR
jgi:hypothetical protein